MNCNGQMQEFTSYVYAGLGLTAAEITNETKKLMEQEFVRTYNKLSFQACDEFFRVVSDVGLVITQRKESDNRLLQESNPAAWAMASMMSTPGITGCTSKCPTKNGSLIVTFFTAVIDSPGLQSITRSTSKKG